MVKRLIFVATISIFLLTFSSNILGQGIGFNTGGQNKQGEEKKAEEKPPAPPAPTKIAPPLPPAPSFDFYGMDMKGLIFFVAVVVVLAVIIVFATVWRSRRDG